MKKFIEWLKSIFTQTPKKEVVDKPVDTVEKPIEQVKPLPIETPPLDKRFVTRYEFIDAYLKIFNKNYNGIRETKGKNRHPIIDKIITTQGGKLADAYCQFGQQQMIDDLCAYFKIDRKKLAYPEGGGTQKVFAAVSSKYKLQTPSEACLITVEYNDSGKGHIEFIVHVDEAKNTTENAAFNSNVDGSDNVRDGEGIGFATRPIFKQMKVGSNVVKLKGYVDLYAIFRDAYSN